MFFAVVATLLAVPTWASSKDNSFFQDVSHRSTYLNKDPIAQWEVLPFGELSADSTLHVQDCFIALWEGSLYSSSRNPNKRDMTLDSPYNAWKKMTWEDVEKSGSKSFSLIESKTDGYSFFLLGSDGVRGVTLTNNQCDSVDKTSAIYTSETTTWSNDAKVTTSADFIWVANPAISVVSDPSVDYGVSQIDIADESLTFLPLDEEVSSLNFVDVWGKLYIGSSARFLTYTYENKKISTKEHEWIGGVIDTAPLDMSYDKVNNALWIAEKNSIHKLLPNGMFLRFGQRQGSPNAEITSVRACNGYVWVGSAVGMARVRGDGDASTHVGFTFKNSQEEEKEKDPWAWNFYGGHRYLPDNKVTAFETAEGPNDSSAVLVVCSTGLSLMDVSLWTLEEKATAVETFQNPRHDRHGLTTQVDLLTYGDVDSYRQACSDNDGLWTSMSGMGQVYRHLVTGSEEARQEAWHHFEGEFCNIYYLYGIGRSVCRVAVFLEQICVHHFLKKLTFYLLIIGIIIF